MPLAAIWAASMLDARGKGGRLSVTIPFPAAGLYIAAAKFAAARTQEQNLGSHARLSIHYLKSAALAPRIKNR